MGRAGKWLSKSKTTAVASPKKICRGSSAPSSARIPTARGWGCPRSDALLARMAGESKLLPAWTEAPFSRFGFRADLASNYRYRKYVDFHGQLVIGFFQGPGSA